MSNSPEKCFPSPTTTSTGNGTFIYSDDDSNPTTLIKNLETSQKEEIMTEKTPVVVNPSRINKPKFEPRLWEKNTRNQGRELDQALIKSLGETSVAVKKERDLKMLLIVMEMLYSLKV